MAGIGFTLRRMTLDASLTSTAVAYFCAFIVVAGPWILTVIGINGISFVACESACLAVNIFRSVVIYNSVLSLIVTTPLAFVCTRFVSDQLFSGRVEGVQYALFAGLSIFFFLAGVVSIPFYVFATSLPPLMRLASIQNAMLIGGTWLLIPFLSVLRDPTALLLGFALGAVVMNGLALFAPHRSSLELLTSFNLGLSVADAIVLWRLTRAFGASIIPQTAFWRAFSQYWELGAAGVAYGFSLWIDKLVMWFFSPIGILKVSGALQTMPRYDTAMFWAQLASLPAVSVFLIHIEPEFFQLSRHIVSRIQNHACLNEVNLSISMLRKFAQRSVFQLLSVALLTSVLGILVTFVAIDLFGIRANQMGILRLALIGTAFQSCAIFCFILLLYLDLRKQALIVSLVFLFFNFVLTSAFLPLGVAFYGYGNMLASVIAFVVSFSILKYELSWLHFHVFITNNRSIQK